MHENEEKRTSVNFSFLVALYIIYGKTYFRCFFEYHKQEGIRCECLRTNMHKNTISLNNKYIERREWRINSMFFYLR